jgi:hypothetical protein
MVQTLLDSDDGSEGSEVSDGPEGSEVSDGPEGSEVSDGPEGSEVSDGPEGSDASSGLGDVAISMNGAVPTCSSVASVASFFTRVRFGFLARVFTTRGFDVLSVAPGSMVAARSYAPAISDTDLVRTPDGSPLCSSRSTVRERDTRLERRGIGFVGGPTK